MDIQEARLPGLGRRYELMTRSGDRVVLVARRDGTFEIGVFDNPRDPDACRLLLQLHNDEAAAISELLAGHGA